MPDEERTTHRVFVGGLFPSVSEDDLRNLFKSFGTVADISIVQRKSDGHVMKTFGHLNLKTTDVQLKKCFAVFGKTKWKGHELKVQLAKEDFMLRLSKEWENHELTAEQPCPVKKPSSLSKRYEDLEAKAKAMKQVVPGTIVQGEQDWVIGKYGRVLPILKMSKHSGKKLLKLDPSKHCHCLKKIADEVGEPTIAELTWSYPDAKPSPCAALCNNLSRKRKNLNGSAGRLDSSTCDRVNAQTTELPGKCVRRSDEKARPKINDVDSLINNRSGDLEDDSLVHSRADVTDNVSSSAPADTESPSSVSRGFPLDHGVAGLKSSIVNGAYLRDEIDWNFDSFPEGTAQAKSLPDNPSKRSLGASIVDQLKARVDLRSQGVVGGNAERRPLSVPRAESRDSSAAALGNAPDGDSSIARNVGFDSVLTQSSVENEEEMSAGEHVGESSPAGTRKAADCCHSEDAVSKTESVSKKRLASEGRRKKSLELKSTLAVQHKRHVQMSLKNLDKDVVEPAGYTRIVFDDRDPGSGDKSDLVNDAKCDALHSSSGSMLEVSGSPQKESGKQRIAKKLDVNSLLSDNLPDCEEEFDEFKIKPQFEGEKGEQLFRLQQKVAGDERFKFDSRFASSESDEEHVSNLADSLGKRSSIGTGTSRMDGVETTDLDLQKEKEHSLAILEKVLGKTIGKRNDVNSSITKAAFERYDPSHADHAKHELAVSKSLSLPSGKGEQTGSDALPPPPPPPAKVTPALGASQEKFFQVDTSLKDLFRTSTGTFSFLGPSADVVESAAGVDAVPLDHAADHKKLNWEKAIEENEMETDGVKDDVEDGARVSTVSEREHVPFFYVLNDNRLSSGGSFARADTMEEIENQWKALRGNLTEDFKKKHKDAMRRQRKLNERTSWHR